MAKQQIVPMAEGPLSPVSARVTEEMIRRLDAVAKSTGNSRGEVIAHILRWGLDEIDRQSDAEKKR